MAYDQSEDQIINALMRQSGQAPQPQPYAPAPVAAPTSNPYPSQGAGLSGVHMSPDALAYLESQNPGSIYQQYLPQGSPQPVIYHPQPLHPPVQHGGGVSSEPAPHRPTRLDGPPRHHRPSRDAIHDRRSNQ